jgi:putative acetyltransferase
VQDRSKTPMTTDPTAEECTIVVFEDRDRDEFERLNRIWLEGNGILEDADLPYLRDPRGTIIDRGGQVFVARVVGKVAGVCGIVPRGEQEFELVKLAVDPETRGRGIGRRLTERAIAFARERGARRVTLSTNSGLTTAIRLYETLGFRRMPPPASPDYLTADVYMELVPR